MTGFGERHPDVARLLASRRPAATRDMAWLNGTLPLRVSAYTTPTELPVDVVSSVRCVVRVGELIVFCANRDGAHPWPGGRREPGESYADTAIREVHEETGWLLDRDSIRPLGWLHLEHLGPRTDDRYPYPDLLQVVLSGTATERDGGVDVDWTDTEGYELSSRLVTIEEARATTSIELLAPCFLDLIGVTPES
ncbi:MAG TPA: NUDIX domain-containing protein [Pseudonocardiaceae bacterium]|nr:NUDIX domain-containing protein [Pseudonocardiaceae bacterium]